MVLVTVHMCLHEQFADVCYFQLHFKQMGGVLCLEFAESHLLLAGSSKSLQCFVLWSGLSTECNARVA